MTSTLQKKKHVVTLVPCCSHPATMHITKRTILADQCDVLGPDGWKRFVVAQPPFQSRMSLITHEFFNAFTFEGTGYLWGSTSFYDSDIQWGRQVTLSYQHHWRRIFLPQKSPPARRIWEIILRLCWQVHRQIVGDTCQISRVNEWSTETFGTPFQLASSHW